MAPKYSEQKEEVKNSVTSTCFHPDRNSKLSGCRDVKDDLSSHLSLSSYPYSR